MSVPGLEQLPLDTNPIVGGSNSYQFSYYFPTNFGA
jgi:hypothetical protein